MSVFMGMLCDMLPRASNLQDKGNDVRKVLDYSVGEYMDNLSEINDELFLTSATGGWLDAWGKDYGVIRRVDEDDDSFRERIIFEKLEYLTARNLKDIYGVRLFYAFDGFDATENDLTSDNPYLTDWYMGVAPAETQAILNNKFVLGTTVMWYNGEELDSITGYPSGNPILKYNFEVYDLSDLSGYSFKSEYKVSLLKLHLSNAVNITYFLTSQNRLTEVLLDCPNVTIANYLFQNCVRLTSVKLNIPKLQSFTDMFKGCSGLETIDVTIPTTLVNSFKSYVLGLELSNLTSFKINGEEVELS